jgi:hypothetical protein
MVHELNWFFSVAAVVVCSFVFAGMGMKPKDLFMLGNCSATELYPKPSVELLILSSHPSLLSTNSGAC